MKMKTKTQNQKTKNSVMVALFCALSYICMFFIRINVLFLTFDLKNSIITLCAMILGPFSAVVTSLVVTLLEMLTVSGTGFYGFIMNFLSAVSFSFVAAFIYKKKKTMTGAILGFAVATVTMTVVMLLFNLLITPYYTGTPVSAVIDIIPNVLLPFNLLKAILSSAVTLALYKPFCSILNKSGFKTDVHGFTLNKTTIAVLVCSIILIALCVVAFLLLLNGNISLIA